MLHSSTSRRRERPRGFTLIELLVVAAILAVLAAILFPVLSRARTQGTVARVHTELAQIGLALQMYSDDCGAFPPARTYCSGLQMKIEDYNELPPELYRQGYIKLRKYLDPFNPGRAYKYIAPGPGFANNVKTILPIWVPEDYPTSTKPCVPYYDQKTAPLKWAVWSVGPTGGVDMFTSEQRQLPVPKWWWFPYRWDGVIVRLSDGRKSP